MSEHRIPRDQIPPPEEVFIIREAATGKSFSVREATDEQLAHHLQDANQVHLQLTKAAMMKIGEAVNAAKVAAVLSYEIDRRSRTLIKILQ